MTRESQGEEGDKDDKRVITQPIERDDKRFIAQPIEMIEIERDTYIHICFFERVCIRERESAGERKREKEQERERYIYI